MPITPKTWSNSDVPSKEDFNRMEENTRILEEAINTLRADMLKYFNGTTTAAKIKVIDIESTSTMTAINLEQKETKGDGGDLL